MRPAVGCYELIIAPSPGWLPFSTPIRPRLRRGKNEVATDVDKGPPQSKWLMAGCVAWSPGLSTRGFALLNHHPLQAELGNHRGALERLRYGQRQGVAAAAFYQQ